MAGFANAVEQYSTKTKGKVDAILRKVALDMFTEVILKSPVGNPTLWKSPALPGYSGGQFRANWQVAIGNIPTGTLQLEDASGTATIAKAQAEVMNLKAGQTIWLVNNLPYAQRLEDGWSTQAPEGMVRMTVQRYAAILNAAAASVRNL